MTGLYQAVMVLPAAELLDRYKLHQMLYDLFERGAGDRDFLYALQPDGCLKVQSGRMPAHLRQVALPVAFPPKGSEISYKIEIRAEYNSRRNGKRIHLPLLATDEKRWRPWMQEKLRSAGIEPSNLFLDDYKVFDVNRPLGKVRDAFKVSHAVFIGTATVEDEALLQSAMKNGIGRGKAYGAGLLNVSIKE